MKKLNIALTLLVAILLGGCTHNNGDIGDLFGQWAVDEVTIDGVYDAEYPYGEVYWMFQNNIVSIGVKLPNHEVLGMGYGTWYKESGKLIVDFDQIMEEGHQAGAIPSWTLVPDNVTTVFTVEQQSGTYMTLSYISSDGEYIRFILRKIK